MTGPTIRIDRTEGSRTVVNPTDSRLTEATFATVDVLTATIDTNRI